LCSLIVCTVDLRWGSGRRAVGVCGVATQSRVFSPQPLGGEWECQYRDGAGCCGVRQRSGLTRPSMAQHDHWNQRKHREGGEDGEVAVRVPTTLHAKGRCAHALAGRVPEPRRRSGLRVMKTDDGWGPHQDHAARSHDAGARRWRCDKRARREMLAMCLP